MLIVNIEEALARLDGDREIYDELITAFLQDSENDLAILRESVSAKDSEKTAYYAHKIKGAALTLGAELLSQQAELLEKAARKNQAQTFDTHFQDMEKEFHVAVEQLTALQKNQ